MPGPEGPWGDALVGAVRAGDRRGRRRPQGAAHPRLAQRVGALEGTTPADPVHVEDGVAFAREAAAEGTVLLRQRRRSLPLDASALRSVAVIGDNAGKARTQGGGSATVVPRHGLPAGGPARRAARRRGQLLASARWCRRAWPSCRWTG